MRLSTSASHACGSMPLSRAVPMRVYMAAARSPNRTVGAAADLVMLDALDPVTALRTVAPVLAAIERGLHDEERDQGDLFLALKKLLRVAFVDRLPGREEHLVVLHHALVVATLGVLVARKGVADR